MQNVITILLYFPIINIIYVCYVFLSLEKLILKNIDLTDRSIKKITLPYRMYKDRSKTLKILDLQGEVLV